MIDCLKKKTAVLIFSRGMEELRKEEADGGYDGTLVLTHTSSVFLISYFFVFLVDLNK